ncbi:MAG: hypothetical protein ACR2MX_18960 [Cyclobacteriaceae bacterium]
MKNTPSLKTTPQSQDTVLMTAKNTGDTLKFEDNNKDLSIVFKRDVQPILENRCQPCHFPNGRMHDRLPFDQAETIHKLGDKIFSRIKDPKEIEVLKRFLSKASRSSEGEELSKDLP